MATPANSALDTVSRLRAEEKGSFLYAESVRRDIQSVVNGLSIIVEGMNRARNTINPTAPTYMLPSLNGTLNGAARNLKNVINISKRALRPLQRIESFSVQVANAVEKSGGGGSPIDSDERNILSYAKGIVASVKLNIQRCEAIKGEIDKLHGELDRLPDAVKGTSNTLAKMKALGEISPRLLQKLTSFENWCQAGVNALKLTLAVIETIIRLEKDAMRRTR